MDPSGEFLEEIGNAFGWLVDKGVKAGKALIGLETCGDYRDIAQMNKFYEDRAEGEKIASVAILGYGLKGVFSKGIKGLGKNIGNFLGKNGDDLTKYGVNDLIKMGVKETRSNVSVNIKSLSPKDGQKIFENFKNEAQKVVTNKNGSQTLFMSDGTKITNYVTSSTKTNGFEIIKKGIKSKIKFKGK